MATVNRLYTILDEIIKKLKKINTKLDYAIRIASENVSITNSYTVGVSGITVNSCTTNMSGNDLFVYASLSLNTTAQNNIGTGSLTPKLILTITCSDLYKDTVNSDNDVNFVKISGADTTVVFPSGEGASPVASFHAVPSISGSNLVIKIYVKNVKAKGSAWFLRVKLPVLRMQPYTN